MIIGVTGFFAAGKDTFADILIQQGYKHVSLSDMLRAELRQRGEEVTIPRLTEVGNLLRAQNGPGVLAEKALRILPTDGESVVTSIRHSAEVEALRARPDFIMVFVDAPIRMRYERSILRGRGGDPITFEAFEEAEKQQMESKDPNAQQLAECKNRADFVVMNVGSAQALQAKVESLIQKATAPKE